MERSVARKTVNDWRKCRISFRKTLIFTVTAVGNLSSCIVIHLDVPHDSLLILMNICLNIWITEYLNTLLDPFQFTFCGTGIWLPDPSFQDGTEITIPMVENTLTFHLYISYCSCWSQFISTSLFFLYHLVPFLLSLIIDILFSILLCNLASYSPPEGYLCIGILEALVQNMALSDLFSFTPQCVAPKFFFATCGRNLLFLFPPKLLFATIFFFSWLQLYIVLCIPHSPSEWFSFSVRTLPIGVGHIS
jgi:hypothetical protein